MVILFAINLCGGKEDNAILGDKMNIKDLKQFVRNRINNLEGQLNDASASGDMDKYAEIDRNLSKTRNTLVKLTTLRED